MGHHTASIIAGCSQRDVYHLTLRPGEEVYSCFVKCQRSYTLYYFC